MPSPEELATRPEYYLQDLDLARRECGFLQVEAGAYRASAFLDQRIKAERRDPVRASLDAMAGLTAAGPQAPISYIFHTAFCCSTLISRSLDIEGACSGLREPGVLMQLANAKRLDSPGWPKGLQTALALLAKCREPGEAVLIKPTNAANNLAEDVLAAPRTGGVLLLYSSLRYFLVSILKKGEPGRAFPLRPVPRP